MLEEHRTIDRSGVSHKSDLMKGEIICGDALEELKKLPDESIDCIITSPPYNIGKEYEKPVELNEYFNQQEQVIKECIRILKSHGSICWQVGNYVKKGSILPLDIPFYNIFVTNGMILKNRIMWHF